MFDKSSRYYTIENATISITDKNDAPKIIIYKKRRFIPKMEGSTTLLEHTVSQGERLDNITARYLGDSTQFWRVCDSNLILDPDELTDEIGRRIKISIPGL